MPGSHDVALAEAAVAEGIITRQQADGLLAEIARVESIGGSVSLETVLINKALATQHQVDKLKGSLAHVRLPRQLAGFQIIQLVERTPHGMLLKARQSSMDRFALLKVLPPRLAGNARCVERLLHEANAAPPVANENLLQIYEAGQASGFCYVAYEFVAGETLAARLARDGRLKQGEALAIAEQMCMALRYVHGERLCHGHIAPERIMLAESGTAKLADLGLCRADGESPELQAELPLYLSPEQASGSPPDIRSDIYSLGAVLYHLVTGTPPFHGATPHDVAAAHVRAALPGPDVLNPALSPEAVALIQNMMAKNPAERYQDPDDLLEEIQSVRMGMPLRKARGTRPRIRQMMEPQRPQPSAAGIAVAVLVALMVIVGGVAVLRSGKSRPPAGPPIGSGQQAPPVAGQLTPETGRLAERALLVADDYCLRNPQNVPEAVDRYLAIVSSYPQTDAARKAEAKAAELQARHETEARTAFERAKADAESFAAAGEFGSAIQACKDFPSNVRFGQWRTAIAEQIALLEKQADDRCEELMAAAAKLAEKKQYTEAIKVLEPGDKLGVDMLTRTIRARRNRYQRELAKERAVTSAAVASEWPDLLKTVARYEKRHLFEQAIKDCDAFEKKFAKSIGGPETPQALMLADLKREVLHCRSVWERVADALRRIDGETDVRLSSATVHGKITEVTASTFTINGQRHRITSIELPEALRIAGVAEAEDRARFLLAEGDLDGAAAEAGRLDGEEETRWLDKIREREKLVGSSIDVDNALAVLDQLQQRAARKEWKPLYLGLRSMQATLPKGAMREIENEHRTLLLQAEAGIAADLKVKDYAPGDLVDLLDVLREREKWLAANPCPKTEPCPGCGGKAKGGVCPQCNGRGTIIMGGQSRVCYRCNGSRKWTCELCKGEGKVRCGECMGRGYKGSMPAEYADAVAELEAEYQLKPEDVMGYVKE